MASKCSLTMNWMPTRVVPSSPASEQRDHVAIERHVEPLQASASSSAPRRRCPCRRPCRGRRRSRPRASALNGGCVHFCGSTLTVSVCPIISSGRLLPLPLRRATRLGRCGFEREHLHRDAFGLEHLLEVIDARDAPGGRSARGRGAPAGGGGGGGRWRRACAASPGAGASVVGSHHPRDRGLATASSLGFVLRAEKLDGKLLVHNYGHGGVGHVAVVGHRADGSRARARTARSPCGRARIWRRWPDHRTSAAAARLRRHDLCVPRAAQHDVEHVARRVHADVGAHRHYRRTPELDAQFRQAVEIAYRQLPSRRVQVMGFRGSINYSPTDEPTIRAGEGQTLLPESVRNGSVILGPGTASVPVDLPLARPNADRAVDLSRCAGAGRPRARRNIVILAVRIAARCVALEDRRHLQPPAASVRKRCSMMRSWSRSKGQLVVLIPQGGGELQHQWQGRVPAGQANAFIHMMPRHDGIILGGTSERDVWTTEINEERAPASGRSAHRAVRAVARPALAGILQNHFAFLNR